MSENKKISSAFVSLKDPQRAPKPTSSNQDDIKPLLAEYFTGELHAKHRGHLFFTRRVKTIRAAMAITGFALAAIPAIRYTLTPEVDWPQIVETEAQQFMMPGLLLLVIAALPIWQSWALPLALVAAAAAGDFWFYELSHNGIVWGLTAIAGLAAIAYLYDWMRGSRPPVAPGDLEPKIDKWIAKQFNSLIDKAKSEIPIPPERLDNPVILKTFPKAERLKGLSVLTQIGEDRRPRISPVGLAAFNFGPENLTMFEGAVDLWSEKIVYARIHLFRYDDIISLTWSSDVSPPDDLEHRTDTAKAILPAAEETGGDALSVVPRRLELQIQLRGQRAVSLVFRDCLIHERLRNKEFEPIEDIIKIRDVWQRLIDAKMTKPPPLVAVAKQKAAV